MKFIAVWRQWGDWYFQVIPVKEMYESKREVYYVSEPTLEKLETLFEEAQHAGKKYEDYIQKIRETQGDAA